MAGGASSTRLVDREKVSCPTCHGHGFIPKANEELVALIPVRDKRLQPNRTSCYGFVAMTVCSIVGGLLVFFLVSRAVTLDSDMSLVYPSNITINNRTGIIVIQFTMAFNLSNGNFFSVSVDWLQIGCLLYGSTMMATARNVSAVIVPMRSTMLHYVEAQVQLDDNYAYLIADCQSSVPILQKLHFNFETTAQISYFSHTEQTTVLLYDREVVCHQQT